VFQLRELYAIVDRSIRQMGVKGLFFEVFEDGKLAWWDGLANACSVTHGTSDCDSYEPWWFYHYIGIMTADKLLTEGSIVWDISATEKVVTVSDVGSLLRNLHAVQDESKDRAGDMSYHASHGLIWYTIASTQPDLTTFPFDLSERYCGDFYGHHTVIAPAVGKGIGAECYHGIGHGMFHVVAQKQLQIQPHVSPRVSLRPSAGFALSDRSWCEVYHLCAGAANMTEAAGYSVDVFDQCLGGVRHSVSLLASDDDPRWHWTTPEEERIQYFEQAMSHCHGRV
jgi:hypothetical protein